MCISVKLVSKLGIAESASICHWWLLLTYCYVKCHINSIKQGYTGR